MPQKPPSQKPLKPLKPGDQKIWDIATADIRKIPQKTYKLNEPAPETKLPSTRLPQGLIRLETLKPPISDPEKGKEKENKSSTQMDRNLKKRFENGELPVDGKIDLHGLTLDGAHRKFTHFMRTKIAAGARFLIIVTGKGSGSANGEGVIKKNLPHWCDAPDIGPHILQRTYAKPHHGGVGATYILLRRLL